MLRQTALKGPGLPIPRLDCLGLIEAMGSRILFTKASGLVERFRGLIASASLKLISGSGLRHWSGVYSRFRGLIASASLKQVRQVDVTMVAAVTGIDSEA